jgi:hypothetical protein
MAVTTGDLEGVVDHYKRVYRARSKEELDSFRAEASFEAAVGRAGRAEHPDGTRYSHQRRRSPTELGRGVANLVRDLSKLEAATNFARIHAAVHQSVGHLAGLNEMYVYDVALHIGAYVGKLPTRIYLHAGTRRGALALGLDAKRAKAIDVFDLPAPLRELAPHELEDVLCIYTNVFLRKEKLEDIEPVCFPLEEQSVRDA